MYDRDMKYARGLMNKEEEKAYLDAEMKRRIQAFVKDKEEEDVYYEGRSEAYREFGHIIEHYKNLLMQRTLQQKAREAADRIRCDECGEQRTCTPLMAKACLKGFIRGYVEAEKLSGSERGANGIGST